MISIFKIFLSLDVETQFMPWLMESVTVELKKTRVARAVLDSMCFFHFFLFFLSNLF